MNGSVNTIKYTKASIGKLAEKNGMWKGDEAKRGAIHLWVRARLQRPDSCQDCGSMKPLDLANISQQYKRDLTDWEWLCRRCHVAKDRDMAYVRSYRRISPRKYIQWEKPYSKHRIQIGNKFFGRFPTLEQALLERNALLNGGYQNF
jgi:hypothetical protein